MGQTCYKIFIFTVLMSGLANVVWAEQLPVLKHTSAETCKECHQEIYQQWQTSMHANSTALKDPIHGTMYQKLMGDPRQEGVRHKKSGKYPICLKCHAPNAASDKITKLDTLPIYNEGVNCITCHTFKKFKGVQRDDGKMNLGIDAYETSEVLQGPSGKVFTQSTELTNFHSTIDSNPTLFRTADICLGCHERRNNSHGIPVCATGEEFTQTDNSNCQQCHMQVVNGLANHNMAGGHSQAMLERSVLMTLETETKENTVLAKVKLRNMTAHNVPTGAPFRNMHVKVTAYDKSGNLVWQNFVKNPIKEDQKSMLMLRLLNGEGKPTAPPKAKQIGEDSRLKPRETRTIVYEIPSLNVKNIQAELYYDLLLPGLKKSPTIPAKLKQSSVIAKAEKNI